MDTFSFSRLSLYESCPYRFYKKYVEGYTEPTTYPLALGKAVHRAIEDKINGIPHQEAVQNGFEEAEFHPEVTWTELSQLANNAPIQDVRGETEVYFKIPLSNELNAPKIQGFIDVIDRNMIIDWKTNRVMYDVRDNHQLGLYAWAVNQMKGMNEVYARLYFLRFRKESSYVFRSHEMEAARQWAYGLAREIQNKLVLLQAMPELKYELFPSKTSSNCSHCPLALECFKKFSPIAKIQ